MARTASKEANTYTCLRKSSVQPDVKANLTCDELQAKASFQPRLVGQSSWGNEYFHTHADGNKRHDFQRHPPNAKGHLAKCKSLCNDDERGNRR